ncbi:MAG: DUF1338 domain-containing protein [Bacteroidales bacterium]|nr:DUF1338 domain-containing protein [Bacteroidales bacterium]
MDNVLKIFNRFWNDYTSQNPLALRISDLFKAEGENVVHDHIALRTFGIEKINLDKVSEIFLKIGYEAKNEYVFEQKQLSGKHFEHKTIKEAPKVFISELKLDNFSQFLKETVLNIINQIPDTLIHNNEFVFGKRLWSQPSFEIYNKLRDESEYAAWLYVHGFRANHFAIFVNALKKFNDIRKVNNFVKSNGYMMNIVNGLETYGSAEELLEQSSTKAEIADIDFIEGHFKVPACFYEFTQRYPDKEGKLYGGFIAASADKIFQSTDYYTLKRNEMM